MGSIDALLRRWKAGDRQQRGRTSAARRGSGQKELPVRWIGSRGAERRRDLQSHRNSQTKRTRPRALLAERTVAHRGTSDQPHRRPAAVESRRRLSSRCVTNTAFRQHGPRTTLTNYLVASILLSTALVLM